MKAETKTNCHMSPVEEASVWPLYRLKSEDNYEKTSSVQPHVETALYGLAWCYSPACCAVLRAGNKDRAGTSMRHYCCQQSQQTSTNEGERKVERYLYLLLAALVNKLLSSTNLTNFPYEQMFTKQHFTFNTCL